MLIPQRRIPNQRMGTSPWPSCKRLEKYRACPSTALCCFPGSFIFPAILKVSALLLSLISDLSLFPHKAPSSLQSLLPPMMSQAPELLGLPCDLPTSGWLRVLWACDPVTVARIAGTCRALCALVYGQQTHDLLWHGVFSRLCAHRASSYPPIIWKSVQEHTLTVV